MLSFAPGHVTQEDSSDILKLSCELGTVARPSGTIKPPLLVFIRWEDRLSRYLPTSLTQHLVLIMKGL